MFPVLHECKNVSGFMFFCSFWRQELPLQANLPPRKTKIVEAKCVDHLIHVNLFINCDEAEEAKIWINDFEKISQTSYSITRTSNVTGRFFAFRRKLHCRHQTRSKNLYDSSKDKNTTRNTNCPSTMLITVHSKKKRYQSKDKARNEIFKEMRCEIELILTHNHNVGSATALCFRKVSNEVREKLINLYCKGHSPVTALKAIKMDIYKNCKNYEQVLADRMHCPNYNYCYNLYVKQFKKKYGNLDVGTPGKDFLKKRLEEYNEQIKDNGVQLVLQEGEYQDFAMDYSDSAIETASTHDNSTQNTSDLKAKNDINDAELIENTKERARVILEEFSGICAQHIEQSPRDVGAALEKMLENMRKIGSVSALTSACSTFASDLDYSSRSRRGKIPVQASPGRTILSEQENYVGRQPRKRKGVTRVRRPKKTVLKLPQIIATYNKQ